MHKSGYITREIVTEVTTVNTSSVQETSRTPSLTWEQFILINVEMDRLASLSRNLLSENESLKSKISSQSNLAAENDELRSKLIIALRENELLKGGSSRISELEARIALLTQENQHFSLAISNHIHEIDVWKLKYQESEENARQYNTLYQSASADIEKLKGELSRLSVHLGSYETLKVEFSKLSANYQALNQTKDNLTAILNQKDLDMSSLREKFNAQGSEISALKNKLSILISENEKLSLIVQEKTKDIDSLKAAIAKYQEIERNFYLVIREKEQLTLTLNEKNTQIQQSGNEGKELKAILIERSREIDTLKSRIGQLESENRVIPQLQARISDLVREKENLVTILTQRDTEIKNLNGQLSVIGQFEHKVALLLTEKERLSKDRDNLNAIILEKTAEIERLRVRAKDAEILEGHVHQLGNERQRLHEVVLDKSKENEGLRMKASMVPGLEDKLDYANKTKENLVTLLNEKERIINELNVRITGYEQRLVDLDQLKGKLALLSSENERLNMILTDKVREIEGLKVRLNELLIVEQKYVVLVKDNSSLNALYNERIREIQILSAKIKDMDAKLSEMSALQGKLALLASENDRLNQIIIEKIQIIQEWELKYTALEQLYISIKETTDHLEIVKRRYQEAVIASEKLDPKLSMRASQSIALRQSGTYNISTVHTRDSSPKRG